MILLNHWKWSLACGWSCAELCLAVVSCQPFVNHMKQKPFSNERKQCIGRVGGFQVTHTQVPVSSSGPRGPTMALWNPCLKVILPHRFGEWGGNSASQASPLPCVHLSSVCWPSSAGAQHLIAVAAVPSCRQLAGTHLTNSCSSLLCQGTRQGGSRTGELEKIQETAEEHVRASSDSAALFWVWQQPAFLHNVFVHIWLHLYVLFST